MRMRVSGSGDVVVVDIESSWKISVRYGILG